MAPALVTTVDCPAYNYAENRLSKLYEYGFPDVEWYVHHCGLTANTCVMKSKSAKRASELRKFILKDFDFRCHRMTLVLFRPTLASIVSVLPISKSWMMLLSILYKRAICLCHAIIDLFSLSKVTQLFVTEKVSKRQFSFFFFLITVEEFLYADCVVSNIVLSNTCIGCSIA